MANVVRFQIRGDTGENWEAINPVLLLNEPGYDRTANRLKIGDGLKKWTELDYIEPSETEEWEFTLEDGSTLTKKVALSDV